MICIYEVYIPIQIMRVYVCTVIGCVPGNFFFTGDWTVFKPICDL